MKHRFFLSVFIIVAGLAGNVWANHEIPNPLDWHQWQFEQQQRNADRQFQAYQAEQYRQQQFRDMEQQREMENRQNELNRQRQFLYESPSGGYRGGDTLGGNRTPLGEIGRGR